jgi:hypothetical protein
MKVGLTFPLVNIPYSADIHRSRINLPICPNHPLEMGKILNYCHKYFLELNSDSVKSLQSIFFKYYRDNKIDYLVNLTIRALIIFEQQDFFG